MNVFKNITGLTQEEMALYLNVSRARWAMYAIGRRGLPVEAMHKLTALLRYLQESDTLLKQSVDSSVRMQRQKQLEEAIVRLSRVKKQLSQMYRNREQLQAAMNTVAFLQTAQNTDALVAAFVDRRIKKSLVSCSPEQTEALECKKRQLEEEIQRLEKELQASDKQK